MAASRKLPDHRALIEPSRRPTFKTSLADAVAELQREHNINPGTIPMRVWRHPYIRRGSR
jgi:hypothetical protein